MRSFESFSSYEHPPPESAADILCDLEINSIQLHDQARDKLLSGDLLGYEAMLYEHTDLVAKLHGRIINFKNSGGDVSQEVASFSEYHSNLAQESLSEGGDYPRVAFFPYGISNKGQSTVRVLADKSSGLL